MVPEESLKSDKLTGLCVTFRFKTSFIHASEGKQSRIEIIDK